MEGNMDLESVKKQEQKDRISSLPDEVLCHILSFLSTLYAVRTSILSSRWKKIWTLNNDLRFQFVPLIWGKNVSYTGCYIEPHHEESFVNFVDHVLRSYHSRTIRNFYLHCSYADIQKSHRISAWISFAVNHNVCKLDLDIFILSEESEENMLQELPQSLFTCKTLVELRLHKDFAVDVPDMVACFPSLKILYMKLQFSDVNQINKLIRNCPVLEELSLDWRLESGNYKMLFDIIVPTLKRLSLNVRRKFGYDTDPKFVVKTPSLEYLNIKDDNLSCYVLDEIPFLSEAVVGFRDGLTRCGFKDKAYRATELLRQVNDAKFLALSVSCLADLGFDFIRCLPTFPNLIRLQLDLDYYLGPKELPHFLNMLPNLEVLILRRRYWSAYVGEEDGKGYVSDDFNMEELDVTPRCLLLHVKVIQLSIIWYDNGTEVAKYLLKNSPVLEKFLVGYGSAYMGERLEKEIRMFPRASKTCKIELSLTGLSDILGT